MAAEPGLKKFENLFSEIEQMTVKELTMTMQVPQDNLDDGQNALR